LKTKDILLNLPVQARILLIRVRSMGDCLLLTSPIRALKEEFPRFRISVLVESRFAGCFEGNPDIEEVLSISRKREALSLVRRRFDLVVNLHGGPTSLTYSLLARGPRIGFEQFQYNRLYQGLLPSPDPKIHSVEATMAAFQWLGVQRETPPPLRYDGRPQRMSPMLGAVRNPYVVIHPAALMETKRWEARKFAELARSLQNLGLSIVLTCGPGEESSVAEVSKDVPSPQILLGLGIPELAELIRGAKLYVGNDSGPMHLAAAVGTPIIALWGSSDSRRWRPWSAEHVVVQNPFECNPCPGYRCLVAPTPLCIESVTVEQAVVAAEQLLKKHDTHPQPR
jgi:predicted lipopolysaccharide heptosyltransferase III